MARLNRFTHVVVLRKEGLPETHPFMRFCITSRPPKTNELVKLRGKTREEDFKVVDVRKMPATFARELHKLSKEVDWVFSDEDTGVNGLIGFGHIHYLLKDNNEGGYDAVSVEYYPKAAVTYVDEDGEVRTKCSGLGAYLEILALKKLKEMVLDKPVTHARTSAGPNDMRKGQLRKTSLNVGENGRCRESIDVWIAQLKKRLYEKRGPVLEPWWRKPFYASWRRRTDASSASK